MVYSHILHSSMRVHGVLAMFLTSGIQRWIRDGSCPLEIKSTCNAYTWENKSQFGMMNEDNEFFSNFSGKADGLKKDLACLIIRFFLPRLLLKLSLKKKQNCLYLKPLPCYQSFVICLFSRKTFRKAPKDCVFLLKIPVQEQQAFLSF